MASASGTESSYQRLLPVLSPPISSIAVRRGSNAYRTRVRPAFKLNPQLAHMRVARRLNPGTMGHSQRWASLLQEADTEVDTLLLDGGQTIPPSAEFIGELNFPCHVLSMS